MSGQLTSQQTLCQTSNGSAHLHASRDGTQEVANLRVRASQGDSPAKTSLCGAAALRRPAHRPSAGHHDALQRVRPQMASCATYTPLVAPTTDRGVGLLAVLFGAYSLCSGRARRTSVHLRPIARRPCPPHREVILLEGSVAPRITPHCPKSEQRAMKPTTDFGSRDALS